MTTTSRDGRQAYDFVDDAQPIESIPSPKVLRQKRRRSMLDLNGNTLPTTTKDDDKVVVKPSVRRRSLQVDGNAEKMTLRKREEKDSKSATSATPAVVTEKAESSRKRPSASSASSAGAEDGEYWCTVGQEVLARWSDGLFYLGKVTKVDRTLGQCLVTYEDKSNFWALYKDLQNVPNKALSIDDMLCNRCHGGDTEQPNQIVICDNCGIGYHQLCHKPMIHDSVLNSRESWHCRLCVFVSATKKGGAVKKGANARLFSKIKLTLPYDPSTLIWNEDHSANKQRCYCYCGGPGEWMMKMLQCYRCRQWYHEACLQCLEQPLLLGDRFFVFVCGICNSGTEYVKRLPLDWPDLGHLALYNLTVSEEEVWFDGSTICTWIIENVALLQLGQGFQQYSVNQWRRRLGCVVSQSELFVSGPRGTYGLRHRTPPTVPQLVLPSGKVDDSIVNRVIEAANLPTIGEDKSKRSSKRTSLPTSSAEKIGPLVSELKKSSSTTSPRRDVVESPSTSEDPIVEINVDVVTIDDDVMDADDGDVSKRDGLDDNNNNRVEAENDVDVVRSNVTGRPRALALALDCLTTFQGAKHPFKTAVEKEEELRIERKKSSVLGQFGAQFKSAAYAEEQLISNIERNRRRNLHIVDALQRKRGKKSEKEKQLLEVAQNVLGLTGSKRRKRKLTEMLMKGHCVETNEKLQKGEDCEIKAKRVLPNGDVQYLIVWQNLK